MNRAALPAQPVGPEDVEHAGEIVAPPAAVADPVPPQVASAARKPLSIGFQEIAADKIKWGDLPEEEIAGEVSDDDAVVAEDSEPES